MALSSLAATAMFMSRSIALQRTVAPRVLSLPERLHAARWRPVLSNAIPHSHTFSITCCGNLGLSRTLLQCGTPASKDTHSIRHRHLVQNASASGLGQRHTIGPTQRSSRKYSEEEEEETQYCQPCGHSWLCLDNSLTLDAHPQTVPHRPANKPLPLQLHCHSAQFSETSTWVPIRQLVDHIVSHDWQPLPCGERQPMMRNMLLAQN